MFSCQLLQPKYTVARHTYIFMLTERGTRKLSQKIISTHFIALNNSKITEIKTKYLRTPIPSILHQVHFCPSRMSWLHAIASFSDFLRVIIALFSLSPSFFWIIMCMHLSRPFSKRSKPPLARSGALDLCPLPLFFLQEPRIKRGKTMPERPKNKPHTHTEKTGSEERKGVDGNFELCD